MVFEFFTGDNPDVEEYDYSYKGPTARSGHRIVITDDYIYAIGGFNVVDGVGRIYKEVWRLNLLTREWALLSVPPNFPSHLASFGVAQMEPYSATILLFGGTAFPFGETLCNDTYVIQLNSNEDEIKSQILDTNGSYVPHVYGHSFARCIDFDNSTAFYSIGGTTGIEYNLDVYFLKLTENGWMWNLEAHPPIGINGMYRFEAVQDGNQLIFFGGGTIVSVEGFSQLYTFDISNRTYGGISTLPDPVFGYPQPRKCHTVSEYKRSVIITGGCGAPRTPTEEPPIYDDVWVLNLDTYRWKKLPISLMLAVYFHDAVVTKHGCIYIFGGVCGLPTRTNLCQRFWLEPPPLKVLVKENLMKLMKDCKILSSFNICHSNFTNKLENVLLKCS